jgi:hypothetical protein
MQIQAGGEFCDVHQPMFLINSPRRLAMRWQRRASRRAALRKLGSRLSLAVLRALRAARRSAALIALSSAKTLRGLQA